MLEVTDEDTKDNDEVTFRESDTSIYSEMKVYPNIASQILTIEDNGEDTYSILTMHGKVVKTRITKVQVD